VQKTTLQTCAIIRTRTIINMYNLAQVTACRYCLICKKSIDTYTFSEQRRFCHVIFLNILLQSVSQEEKIWCDVISGMAPVSTNFLCTAPVYERQTLVRIREESICSSQLKLLFVRVNHCHSHTTLLQINTMQIRSFRLHKPFSECSYVTHKYSSLILLMVPLCSTSSLEASL